MSTWRDIWRYGVIANRLFAENEERGELAFKKLKEVYDKPKKLFNDGRDGMIRYIIAEAYESKYGINKNEKYKSLAEKNYKEAKKLFPVAHWKEVAQNSLTRINNSQTAEEYYTEKSIKITDKDVKFNELLWFAFQKVYTFTNLNDFARYVSLSSLSRGSSEWPLSLIDFRTVLEIEINQCFPQIINEFDEKINRYSLNKTIEKLEIRNLIDNDIRKAFDNIRMAGNLATHKPENLSDEFKTKNVEQFIKTLNYFNNYRKEHNVPSLDINAYPLCQLTLDEYIEELDKKCKKSN